MFPNANPIISLIRESLSSRHTSHLLCKISTNMYTGSEHKQQDMSSIHRKEYLRFTFYDSLLEARTSWFELVHSLSCNQDTSKSDYIYKVTTTNYIFYHEY